MKTLPDDFYSLRKGPYPSLSDIWVVIPTVRPESISEFLSRWGAPDLGVRFLIVHDDDSLIGPPGSDCDDVFRISCESLPKVLGERSWIIPRRTDCVRSYGFLQAARWGAKYILSMDDDCYPADGRPEDFFMGHLEILSGGLEPSFSTTGMRDSSMRPRGILRRDGEAIPLRRVLINHGLWDGNLDLAGDDSVDTMSFLGRRDVPMRWLPPRFDVIPHGFSYPMCGMNVSFSVDILPAMYFTLQGRMMIEGFEQKLGYDRWGDIWCGLFSKMVADEIGGYVTSGVPRVFHSRASSATSSMSKERDGHYLHQKLVRHILEGVHIRPRGPICMENTAGMYLDIAESLENVPNTNHDERAYLRLLSEAMRQWTELCLTFARGS